MQGKAATPEAVLMFIQRLFTFRLRHNLGDILDQVANKHERSLVKRAGIPAAILLSVTDYTDYKDLEDLVET